MKGQIVFRADAGPLIGAGHIARCGALADALLAMGWMCTFAGRRETAEVVAIFMQGRHRFIALSDHEADDPQVLGAQFSDPVDWLVVDHYGLGEVYEREARTWARRVMVIDELLNRPHDADLLLDQTLGRPDRMIRPLVPLTCDLLIGPSYALIRDAFKARRAQALARRNFSLTRILVSFGAGNPDHAIEQSFNGIREAGIDAKIDVAAASAAIDRDQLAGHARDLDLDVTIHLDTGHMADLMMLADVAIGAGGVSSWERCCLGLPAVLLVTAENQRGNAETLAGAGAVKFAGQTGSAATASIALMLRELADPGEWKRVSLSAAALCDGSGADRIAMVMDSAYNDAMTNHSIQ